MGDSSREARSLDFRYASKHLFFHVLQSTIADIFSLFYFTNMIVLHCPRDVFTYYVSESAASPIFNLKLLMDWGDTHRKQRKPFMYAKNIAVSQWKPDRNLYLPRILRTLLVGDDELTKSHLTKYLLKNKRVLLSEWHQFVSGMYMGQSNALDTVETETHIINNDYTKTLMWILHTERWCGMALTVNAHPAGLICKDSAQI